MVFQTLSDDDEKELYRLQRVYWRDAKRCMSAQAYLAGSVMLGSALEKLLMLMANVFAEEAAATDDERHPAEPSAAGASAASLPAHS